MHSPYHNSHRLTLTNTSRDVPKYSRKTSLPPQLNSGSAYAGNPWPGGRLSVVTYPNIDDTWDVRAIVVTSDEPYETRVLGHVNDSRCELTGLREMLHSLQQAHRRILQEMLTGDILISSGIENGHMDALRRWHRRRGSCKTAKRTRDAIGAHAAWDTATSRRMGGRRSLS